MTSAVMLKSGLMSRISIRIYYQPIKNGKQPFDTQEGS
jgi:hypothetical protein